MIKYDKNTRFSLKVLCQSYGSVFPWALKFATPCAGLAFVIKYSLDQNFWNTETLFENFSLESNVYGGFSTLLGFLVVFRTGQAHNRFWDGGTLTHQMTGDWFDSVCSLFSFTHMSTADEKDVTEFKHTIVRLFSMLHALAVGELTEEGEHGSSEAGSWAGTLEILDARGIDRDSLQYLKISGCKSELVFYWIQSVVVKSIKEGVLTIPPPILTRAFQEMASGMLKFHEALKIADIPFPFPYAQVSLVLLSMHWVITPLVVCKWTGNCWTAFTFAFIQVFLLWSLHAIAVELENPYGQDANDLNTIDMQSSMNKRLLLLLDPRSSTIPYLTTEAAIDNTFLKHKPYLTTFYDVWKEMPQEMKEPRQSWTGLNWAQYTAKLDREKECMKRNSLDEAAFAVTKVDGHGSAVGPPAERSISLGSPASVGEEDPVPAHEACVGSTSQVPLVCDPAPREGSQPRASAQKRDTEVPAWIPIHREKDFSAWKPIPERPQIIVDRSHPKVFDEPMRFGNPAQDALSTQPAKEIAGRPRLIQAEGPPHQPGTELPNMHAYQSPEVDGSRSQSRTSMGTTMRVGCMIDLQMVGKTVQPAGVQWVPLNPQSTTASAFPTFPVAENYQADGRFSDAVGLPGPESRIAVTNQRL